MSSLHGYLVYMISWPRLDADIEVWFANRFRLLSSPSLQGRKLRARQFCISYNQDEIPNDPKVPPEKVFQGLRNRREKMLRTIIGEVGEQPVIEPPFNFQYGSNIALGDKFYANVK